MKLGNFSVNHKTKNYPQKKKMLEIVVYAVDAYISLADSP